MSSPAPYAPWPPPMPWQPPRPPAHPMARRSLVVGIIGLAAGIIMVVPVVLSPLAWYWGAAAKNAIDRDPVQWSGRSDAKGGLILGIIGTGILIAGLIFLAGMVALAFFASTYEAGY